MLGVIPILPRVQRSASELCPCLGQHGTGTLSPGHLPQDMAWVRGAHANPSQVGHRQDMLDAPWLGRLTGPKASKTGLKASKGT